MRVKMHEDRKVTVDGVHTIDAAAGEIYEMGEGVAQSLFDQNAAEPAHPGAELSEVHEAKAEPDADENKDAGAADENKDGTDEAPLPTVDELLKNNDRPALEQAYNALTGGNGSAAPNKKALAEAIVAAREAAAAGE